jgi:hypothetical protein
MPLLVERGDGPIVNVSSVGTELIVDSGMLKSG